jgi:hypothetical protein
MLLASLQPDFPLENQMSDPESAKAPKRSQKAKTATSNACIYKE